MTKEGSTNVVNFMTPGAGVLALERGHMLYSGNAFFPNKIIFFTPRIKQTKYIVKMTKEGSIKMVTFMTPTAGVLSLGRGHISHIVKMHYFFKNLLHSQA